MKSDPIKIISARENNLKNVSLEIPKRQITVFTGVSGAGKSSLVFDTIAAEAQRQFKATYTNYLPLAGQPRADSLESLSPAVVIDQKPLRGNARSTVGTITEIFSLLRLLYSRVGEPHVGYSNAFSFNEPEGMCPVCEGIGETLTLDLNKLLDREKSLSDGAIRFSLLDHEWRRYASMGLFDSDKPVADYDEQELDMLLHGETVLEATTKTGTANINYEGLVDTFRRRYIQRDISSLAESTRRQIDEFTARDVCPSCGGTRLNQEALNCEIDGYNIAELAAMEVNELINVISTLDIKDGRPIVESIVDGLENLLTLGLGYLTLDRETMTLSGGESQRIKMMRNLGSSITDLTYIFDEPTIGLHLQDIEGLNELLKKFRDQGNTVLVVEHEPAVIEIADHVVDLGPGPGKHGGEIVYEGSVVGLRKSDTLTGKHMNNRASIKDSFRQSVGQMTVTGASRYNLKNISVDIPVGILTAITGVAGAGKSTLLEVFLEEHPGAIAVDQQAVRTSTRSVTATYTGMMDDIRDQFARENDVSRSLFSFNSEGACSKCEGLGKIHIDLPFMDPVETTCETCRGKRYKEDVLKYTLRGKSISDVLNMTVNEALKFFRKPALKKTLKSLADVGLSYLTLGQPLSSFSGGECQRIKLAGELHKSGSIYVLDEPTTGLHMADIDRMIKLLDRMVEAGNTVIVIEHNLDIVKNADWVIDLGPGGGSAGGEIVFQGTPAQLKNSKTSITARYLK